MPNDKSLGKKLKSFAFWFLTILKLIPFYGINVITYLILFLIIDKGDDY